MAFNIPYLISYHEKNSFDSSFTLLSQPLSGDEIPGRNSWISKDI